MDPVTHLLTGACMGRAGFNRKSALATVTMVLAAEAADIDVVWGLKGSIPALQHHRGITHSFVGVPFIAAAIVGAVYLGHRIRWHRSAKSVSSPGDPPIRWGFLYFCALLAALSHLLLDYTTAYGIRLFEPFDYRWYSWDIVSIIEPLMLLALIGGLTVPAFLGLISREVGARSKGPRGRAAAIIALIMVAVIWGVRDYQHRRALNAMNSFLYNNTDPIRLAAYPYMINPFRWHGVVETRDFFESVPVNSLTPDVDSEHGILYYKPVETPAISAAKASYLGRVYLDWAAFPFVRQQNLTSDPAGYLEEFQDLRYTYPSTVGKPPLSGFVLLNDELRILEQGMNSSRSAAVRRMQDAFGRR
ncbi:MAG TPA: metal-dependent hydrolase [Terriglobales bacterium]|nr:metal-dependent hydrolase [Terriglobales bacterium]